MCWGTGSKRWADSSRHHRPARRGSKPPPSFSGCATRWRRGRGLGVRGGGAEPRGRLIASSSPGQAGIEPAPIVQRLRDAMAAEPVSSPLEPQAGIDPEILKVLTEYEGHRLQENIKA